MIRIYSVLLVVISAIQIRVLEGNAVTTVIGSFEELTRTCKQFATPQLWFSPTNDTIELDGNTEFPLLNDGEAALVGYAKDYVLIELIGCAKVSDISRPNQPITQLYEPAICYTICGTNKVFAVMKTVNNTETVQCLCVYPYIVGIVNTTVNMCNETCGNSHLLCGMHGHVAMYRPKMNSVLDVESLKDKESSLEDGLNCLSLFNPPNNLFEWNNCYENYTSACSLDRNAKFTSGKTSWTMAATACLSRGGRLMTRDEALTVTGKSTQAWTADVRILTVVDNSDFSTASRQFGYISRIGNKYTISFTRNTSIVNKGWCEQGFDELYVQNGTICESNSKKCTLATPKLEGHDHFSVSVDNETRSRLTPNNGTWVGYTRDYVVLQITGCINITDILKGKYIIQSDVVSNPFYCATLCTEYEQFGLSTYNKTFSVCMCIQFINYNLAAINTTRHGCNITCKPPSDIVCGGHHSFAAVYRKVLETNSSLTGEGDGGDCLSYGPKHKFSWRNCNVTSIPACISDLNATRDDTELELLPWSKAIAKCFQYDRYPIPLRTNIHKTRNNGGSWSGIIRGKTILSMDEREFCSSSLREYGYISMDEDQFYLDFTNDTTRFHRTLCNSSVEKITTEPGDYKQTTHTTRFDRTLCNSTVGKITTEPGDYKQTTDTTKFYRIMSHSTVEQITTEPVDNKQTTGKVDHEDSHTANASDTTNDVGVYAGVIVAFVVVVIAASGGYCYWNRRKNYHKKRGERHNRENNGDQHISISLANVTYNEDTHIAILAGAGRNVNTPSKESEDTVDTCAPDSHYFILDKVHNISHAPGEDCKDTVDSSLSDPQYSVPEKRRDNRQVACTGSKDGADDDNYNVIEADTTPMEDEGYGSKHHMNNNDNTSTFLMSDKRQIKTDNCDSDRINQGERNDMPDVYDNVNQRETNGMHEDYDRIHPDKSNGILSDDYDHIGPTGHRSENVEHYDTVSAVQNNMSEGTYDTTANVNKISETDEHYYDSTSGHQHDRCHGVYDTTVNIRMGDNDGHYNTTSELKYNTRSDTYDTTVNIKMDANEGHYDTASEYQKNVSGHDNTNTYDTAANIM